MGTGRKHYKIGKGTYGERVRGYTVARYVRRVSPRKVHLLTRLKSSRQHYKVHGTFLPGYRQSNRAYHYAPAKHASRAIVRGLTSGSIKQKQAAVGRAIRIASRSGTPTVQSVSVSRPVTVVPAPPSARRRAPTVVRHYSTRNRP